MTVSLTSKDAESREGVEDQDGGEDEPVQPH